MSEVITSYLIAWTGLTAGLASGWLFLWLARRANRRPEVVSLQTLIDRDRVGGWW